MLDRPWDTEPTPLQQALARGHRWFVMLESGEVRSMKEIARRERVDDSYVSRMVNLNGLLSHSSGSIPCCKARFASWFKVPTHRG
jgi:hypothetical protein